MQHKITSPFSIVCTTTTGCLLEIGAVDFQKKILKDKDLIELLKNNYNHKCEEVENKRKNMNNSLKYATKLEPVSDFVFVDEKNQIDERDKAIINSKPVKELK